MSTTAKSKILFLLIVPAILYIISLNITPLLDPDETRYSEIADSMNDTGDYVTPRLNHVVYLEKPPLTFWATVLAFKAFGKNEFSARLFVGLCAWGCILLTFAMGSYLYDEKTGLYSAGVLSTFLYLYVLGRMNILDIPLTFFVGLATWAGYRYMVGERLVKSWLYLLYAASALAFLTKGLIGIIFPFAILVLWLLVSKKGRDILKLISPVGLLILAAIVFPWIILVQKANKIFLWYFFVYQHFLRYATKIHGRYQFILFYLPVVVLGISPWIAYLIQAIRAKYAGLYNVVFGRMKLSFLITWIVFIFIFFSVSSSKLIPYIAPVFLPLAVILGHLFRGYDEQEWRPLRKMTDKLYHYLPVILQSLFFITLLLLPLILKDKTEIGGDLVITQPRNWIWMILPPIIIQLLMIILPDIIKRRFNSGWFSTAYLLSALFLASLIHPVSAFLEPYNSSYQLSQAIKQNLPAGEMIYQYKSFSYGIENYTDIRTAVVGSFGEMNLGVVLISADERAKYFLFPHEFFLLVREKKGAVYCVTTKENNLKELRKEFPHLQVIWSNNIQHFVRLQH
ncbi:MAG TPA: glycosyltransferase family 39 protein [Smithellaceae bacterium]|nr:glycosyltransferase family 39 protein [Smithellaceae bacterium]